MPRTNVGRFGKEKREAYLAALASGLRRGAAAESIGANRETIRRHYTADPTFLAEIEQAELDACEQVEDALYQAAISGNVVACQVWLYNRAPDRWADKRNLNMKAEFAGKVEHSGLDDIGLRELVVALNGLETKDGAV